MGKRGRLWALGAFFTFGLFFGAWGMLPRGEAQKQGKAPALPDDLARAPAKAMVMVSFRPADLWGSPLGKDIRAKLGKDEAALAAGLKESVGLAPAAVARMTFVQGQPGAESPLLLIGTVAKVDRKALLAAVVPGAEEKEHNQQKYYIKRGKALAFLGDRAYALGERDNIEGLLDAEPGKGEGMRPGYALAAKNHSLVMAVNPTAFPPLPARVETELAAFVPLLKAGLGTFTLDVGEKSTGALRITFPKAEDAKAGLKAAQAGQQVVQDQLQVFIKLMEKDKTAKGVVAFLKLVEGSLTKAKVMQKDRELTSTIELKVEAKQLAQVSAEMVARVRTAAARMESSNNLKQIGLALHNYHDRHMALPAAAIYDKNGKALLSWRVSILPYIEQNELYKEFKLDEPWDSKHNKKLLEKMPKIYVVPGSKPKNKFGTYYQGFVGKSAFFEGKTGLRFADITDGTSNTIMVAEAAVDVPWTKPDDLAFDADKALPKLGGHTAGGFMALFGDGSVRFISATVKKDTLKAMITRNGGEIIATDD